MLICAVGDIHGAMDRMYEDILAFEAALDVRFEWVPHVSDFAAWPDVNRIDKATKKHDGAGDFPMWFADRPAPRAWKRVRRLAAADSAAVSIRTTR